MSGLTLESPHNHVIWLPKLSQEEMQILYQKPANKPHILMQGLVLSLYGDKDGFDKALEYLRSCQIESPKPVKEMLEKRIALLLSGNIRAWTKLCEVAEKRPESPVCEIVLRISPLGKGGIQHG